MRYQKHILAAFLACLLLLNGCASTGPTNPPVSSTPEQQQTVILPETEHTENLQAEIEQPPTEEAPSDSAPSETPSDAQSDAVISATPAEADTPEPVEPEDAQITQTVNICTISISCVTILDNLDNLTAGKEDLVPADGWLLEPIEVTFNEGESVFQVLRRTCKQQKLHMEFEDTPIYNSAYIEGIGNLYEFDCGELSGWKYCVNGWFPNYGCSRYPVQSGDVIEWVYTCDLGADVGSGESP